MGLCHPCCYCCLRFSSISTTTSIAHMMNTTIITVNQVLNQAGSVGAGLDVGVAVGAGDDVEVGVGVEVTVGVGVADGAR